MQSLNSLYFPQTALPRHQRNCLLLLPDTLHLLQPVEPGGEETDETSDSDLFMERGICQVHTPSHLGKDRDRFLGLIHEIRTRKDGYAKQLSNLTLANLSKVQDSGDHSHQAIIANLLDGQSLIDKEAAEEAQGGKLWQARLILALAEILDREEAELAMNLSDIDSDELALFQELKGEMEGETGDEDDPFAELLRIKAKMGQPRPGTMNKRFQAWKTLYNSGTLPENYWLWTTCEEEAADILLSNYEAQSGRLSVPLLLLDLPEQMYLQDKDALKRIRAFQEEGALLRDSITEKLTAIIKQGHLDLVDPVALLPDAGILARDWNELIDYHFPEERFGRRKLDLQFLANVSLDTLLRGPSASRQTDDDICHGILALYRE
ncbi:MAG: hypothetical protein KKD01_19180 [Proteobacteria bacterium]|nr:hypothetical protein [Pseudomonadota bacterium]MBU1420067.1 hypothetical protein [Pseudomonadota bacterium]MBU1456845.1 hypothetical protein [Pseudomonadota bacterium]